SSSDKTKKHDEKTKREAKGKNPVELSIGVRDLSDDFNEFYDNSTNGAAGPSYNAVSSNFKLGGKSLYVDPSQYPDDTDMPALEDITYSDDEKDVGTIRKEATSVQQYVLLPLWSFGSKDHQNTDNATFEVKEPESEVHVSLSSSDKTKKHDEKTKRDSLYLKSESKKLKFPS
nr:hypothetical protein [Tanacetum cinerariifolium]